ncbi:C4-dicarboxylate ABC transporter [Synergistales bacterium]|nr:C4-dicarboxylate ABC transporter [Synergistales bacterium]
MEEYAVISLVALVAAIILGFWTKINIGVIAVTFAFIVGHFIVGKEPSSIYLTGWPMSLFFMLTGMTLLFGVARLNGTFSALAKQMSYFSFGSRRMMCLIIYLFSAILSMVGVGTIVTPAILCPLVIEIARVEDIPEPLVILLCIAGGMAGGMSPIAPTGIIGINLSTPIGLKSYTPIFIMCILTFSIQALVFFLAFGGWKLSKTQPKHQHRPPLELDRNQIITVVVTGIVVFCVLVLKYDLGLTSFTGAAVLLLLRAEDQKKVVASVAWGTILMICGVSMLVKVITDVGGINLISEYLAKIMSPYTAPAIMDLMAGTLSSVSSSSGVVMPTFIPTIPGLLSKFGNAVSIEEMVAAVIIGAHSVAYSPLSTLGGIGIAMASDRVNKQKFFTALLFCGIGMVILTAALFLFRIYNFML